MNQSTITRDQCQTWDNEDPLAHKRAQFTLPAGLIYLDGNSLGPLPRGVGDAVKECINHDWGQGLIRSWNDADWISLPQRLGDRIGTLIGAAPGQTVVTDSTSINLYKALSAALSVNPDRTVIVSELDNFPTDLYISEGVQRSQPQLSRRLLGRDGDDLLALITADVGVVYLTHVNYKTAKIHDMRAITQRAHDVGAVVVWDLAHSAGAMPLAVDECDVDFAVGCTYKYINGGPGSPAFVYINKRLQGQVEQPLSGWFAHENPFAFTPEYTSAKDSRQFLCGTPPVLSFVALQSALDQFDDVTFALIRDKSLRLTRLFMDLIEQTCAAHGFTIITPQTDAERASHVSLTHPEGYAIVQALIDRQVIGDFRAPDILRFGFAPLFNQYTDVFDAVAHLSDIMTHASWRDPKFQQRRAVT